MNDLTTVLQRLIQTAGASLPKETGETEKLGGRFARAAGGLVILCDLSGSMGEPAGSRTKVELLREAVGAIWLELDSRLRGNDGGVSLWKFSDRPEKIETPAGLESPSGATDLAAGLVAIAAERPARTIVISDGRPDSESVALEAAAELTGRIDVIYVGPETDTAAIDFMRRLARAGQGSVICTDLVKHASGRGVLIGCRKLLGLPAPGGGRGGEGETRRGGEKK